jgi:hypothetical protein
MKESKSNDRRTMHRHGVNIHAITIAIHQKVGKSKSALDTSIGELFNSNGTINRLSEVEKTLAREQVNKQLSVLLGQFNHALSLLQ